MIKRSGNARIAERKNCRRLFNLVIFTDREYAIFTAKKALKWNLNAAACGILTIKSRVLFLAFMSGIIMQSFWNVPVMSSFETNEQILNKGALFIFKVELRENNYNACTSSCVI